jgi:hypothetical protein
MTSPVVFYAWQSDRPRASTRDIVYDAAYAALARIGSTMRIEESPRLDQDTKNESGTPPIAETIYRKIKNSALFLADVTFCCDISDDKGKVKKRIPNPNVMMELGFAAATIGWSRIIVVLNKKYGSPESLPFDLRTHRFPITYELAPNSEKLEQATLELGNELELAIREGLTAEYELVDATMSRLSSYSRFVMKKHGPREPFRELQADNTVLSRLDLAIAQMLELNVIRCVDVVSETGCEYAWTYLGKQCCYRLGVVEPIPTRLQVPIIAPPQVVVETPYLDALRQKQETEARGSEDLGNEEKNAEG